MNFHIRKLIRHELVHWLLLYFDTTFNPTVAQSTASNLLSLYTVPPTRFGLSIDVPEDGHVEAEMWRHIVYGQMTVFC
jgi:hypothetical protein